MLKKIFCLILTFSIAVNPLTAYGQHQITATSGLLLDPGQNHDLPLIKGLKVSMDDPFRIDFILDLGKERGTQSREHGINHQRMDFAPSKGLAPGSALKQDASRLVKYFLASLAIPEKDLWVNLSPYEKDRILPDILATTDMGRDLLLQDYVLKRMTASLLYPDSPSGKEFWRKVYSEAQKKYGTTDIPIDTFNKVWIMPDKATVYEKNNAAFVVESRLKVMIESDYLAESKEHGAKSQKQNKINANPEKKSDNSLHPSMLSAPGSMLARQVLKEIIIPVLEREVNEGAHFAVLRQVYQALVLAAWYKRKLKASVLGRAYADRKKTHGIETSETSAKEKIWQEYSETFRKGVYNLIREESDPYTLETIPRKYFSGGVVLSVDAAMQVTAQPGLLPSDIPQERWLEVPVRLVDAGPVKAPATSDPAMTYQLPVKLHALIKSLVYAEDDVDINIDIDENLWISDAGSLGMAFRELLNNAVDASRIHKATSGQDKKPNILIKAAPHDQAWVELSITNEGVLPIAELRALAQSEGVWRMRPGEHGQNWRSYSFLTTSEIAGDTKIPSERISDSELDRLPDEFFIFYVQGLSSKTPAALDKADLPDRTIHGYAGQGLKLAWSIMRRISPKTPIRYTQRTLNQTPTITFSVLLPLAKPDQAMRQASPAQGLSPAQAEEIARILIPEDNLSEWTKYISPAPGPVAVYRDITRLWTPHLNDIWLLSGLPAEGFITQLRQGTLRQDLQKSLEDIVLMSRNQSGGLPGHAVDAELLEDILENKAADIVLNSSSRRIKILLGGVLDYEIRSITGQVYQALLRTAERAHIPAASIPEWIATWDISIVGYSINTARLLETENSLRLAPLAEGSGWLRLEYLDLLDPLQRQRMAREQPDIVLTVSSLYLGNLARAEETETNRPLFDYVRAIYEMLPAGGILVTERPKFADPPFAPFVNVSPSYGNAERSGVFVKTSPAEYSLFLLGGGENSAFENALYDMRNSFLDGNIEQAGLTAFTAFAKYLPYHQGPLRFSRKEVLAVLTDYLSEARPFSAEVRQLHDRLTSLPLEAGDTEIHRTMAPLPELPQARNMIAQAEPVPEQNKEKWALARALYRRLHNKIFTFRLPEVPQELWASHLFTPRFFLLLRLTLISSHLWILNETPQQPAESISSILLSLKTLSQALNALAHPEEFIPADPAGRREWAETFISRHPSLASKEVKNTVPAVQKMQALLILSGHGHALASIAQRARGLEVEFELYHARIKDLLQPPSLSSDPAMEEGLGRTPLKRRTVLTGFRDQNTIIFPGILDPQDMIREELEADHRPGSILVDKFYATHLDQAPPGLLALISEMFPSSARSSNISVARLIEELLRNRYRGLRNEDEQNDWTVGVKVFLGHDGRHILKLELSQPDLKLPPGEPDLWEVIAGNAALSLKNMAKSDYRRARGLLVHKGTAYKLYARLLRQGHPLGLQYKRFAGEELTTTLWAETDNFLLGTETLLAPYEPDPVSSEDQAMSHETPQKGGIDLNTGHLALDVKQASGPEQPLFSGPDIHITGLMPVILNLKPLNISLKEFLHT
jgi:hypothetical protein